MVSGHAVFVIFHWITDDTGKAAGVFAATGLLESL